MGRVIAIANQKGGVGKTTTAINLALALAELDRRVLLIDLDPQGNATSGLLNPSQISSIKTSRRTIYESLLDSHPLTSITISARPNLDLAPSSPDLVGAELELAALDSRERRLAAALELIVDNYNYLLIDTPPSLGLLTLAALVAANSVLIPIQSEYYALEGLSALLATISRVRERLNPALAIEGLVLTMFDSRNRLAHDISSEVRAHFPDRLFATVIPRSVRISESPSHGLAVLEYDSRSIGAQRYRALAAELLARALPPNSVAGEGEDVGARAAAPFLSSRAQRAPARAVEGSSRSEPLPPRVHHTRFPSRRTRELGIAAPQSPSPFPRSVAGEGHDGGPAPAPQPLTSPANLSDNPTDRKPRNPPS